MYNNVPKEWINLNRVSLFDLQEYISKIKLNDKVLFHLEDTADNFNDYIESLKYHFGEDEGPLMLYWLDQSLNELKVSSEVENHTFKTVDMVNENLAFDKLAISHERIKKIHRFVCEHSDTFSEVAGEYRKNEAFVGINNKDERQVYWYGAEPKDIKPFIDSFIKFYKANGLSTVYSNPFIKAALAHLLFVRIHPFSDGNGRTARIIQNISFTNSINKMYDTNLKVSPLNVSQNIKMNVYNYADAINRIYFDLEHDNNEWVNYYLNYMLNMYDEQMYYQTNRMPLVDTVMNENVYYKDDIINKAPKARVKKLFKQGIKR